MGCICHSFALCSAAACNKLDPSIVEFSHELYSFVASSPKRLHEFQEYEFAVDTIYIKLYQVGGCCRTFTGKVASSNSFL
jgi:hypothetical protein